MLTIFNNFFLLFYNTISNKKITLPLPAGPITIWAKRTIFLKKLSLNLNKKYWKIIQSDIPLKKRTLIKKEILIF